MFWELTIFVPLKDKLMLGRTKDFGKDIKYLIELHEIAIDVSEKWLVGMYIFTWST